ncbi:MAG: DUF192 domain-containing protein [Spirochaetia bacterium]|nr:DUF192 domain-containing protein [Spirochaetia bacterium]
MSDRQRRGWRIQAAVLLPVLLLSCTSSLRYDQLSLREQVSLQIGSEVFTLDVAATQSSRTAGLSHRDSLGPDEGMLFIFEGTQEVRFWMKGTSIPLEILWLDRSGRVIGYDTMIPYSLEPVASPNAVRAAIELSQGAMARAGAGPGTRIKLICDP